MPTLEQKLHLAYETYGFNKGQQRRLDYRLAELKAHHEPTYEHTIRVALAAARTADFMHLEGKALLYFGLLHDMGKLDIPRELLDKKEAFDASDREQIKAHVAHSHRRMKQSHPISAEVAMNHHVFQEHGYPDDLQWNISLTKANKAALGFYTLLVHLIDSYDAASTRVNTIEGERRMLSPKEVRKRLVQDHPHFTYLIGELYDHGVLR